MADGVKSVMITKEVAATMGGVRKRATRKKQAGGNTIVRGVSEDMMAVKGVQAATTAASTNPTTWLSYPSTVVPPRTPVSMNPNPVSASESAAPTAMYKAQGGEAKNIRVELKKRESAKKVKLHPKKESKSVPKKSLTKKSRKITLGVASLHKRMTRAKKVQHTMKAMPIDKLKKLLIQKKLIKPTSKAPESILRQIAADSQIVEGKSL
jgi:CCR4-NOT transcriptional regulation complex NOT5 subunit